MGRILGAQMPGKKLDEALVKLVLSRPMAVAGPVLWGRVHDDDVWVKATLLVSHSDPELTIRLKLNQSLVVPEKFSFTLLLEDQRIRSVDGAGNHGNKHTDSNRWVFQAHYHEWTDTCHGNWARDAAYYPVDLEQAFFLFCDELGIDRQRLIWNPPPAAQLKLGL